MESIRIKFTDFSKDFNPEDNYFTDLLQTRYVLDFSEDPDFVIHSVYGYDFLKYDCIRILYTGESNTPDFNLSDYAMGFDWLTFEDRYLRLPLYYVRNKSKHYNFCLQPFTYAPKDIENRKFCNFIYSNSKADKKRTEFFHSLSKYKFVHSGGKYMNNIGGRVENKLDYQKDFKFSIAFENSSIYGYSTEKILEAKVAGTVPIYWGNPVISREMNTEAFINCHDFSSFDEVINHIIKLDNDDEEYLNILNTPLFKKDLYNLNNNRILDFFDNIFSKRERKRDGHFQRHFEKKFQQYRIFENIKRNSILNFFIRLLKL